MRCTDYFCNIGITLVNMKVFIYKNNLYNGICNLIFYFLDNCKNTIFQEKFYIGSPKYCGELLCPCHCFDIPNRTEMIFTVRGRTQTT